jgi:hypothetical protein
VVQGLLAEDGRPAFFDSAAGIRLELERNVTTMNESRPTSVDVFFDGRQRVAVEVKFAEDEFGVCSRPALTPTSPNFSRDYCDGTYSIQRGRSDSVLYRRKASDIGNIYLNSSTGRSA